MKQYLDALTQISEIGIDRKGRNGYTRALFAIQLRFDLRQGFPAVTTKKLAFNAVKSELLWFIEGSSDEHRLREIAGTDRTVWTDNAEADYWKPKAQFPGDLGRIYGVQWRRWRNGKGSSIDQLDEVIKKIRKDPNDRRLVVTAWNPAELDQMALPPCHMLFQFFVGADLNGPTLSLHMVQRSCDMFLGVPFNIASYGLLLSMVAQVVKMRAAELVITLNDAHIYHEHFNAVKEQLTRTPFKLPTLSLNPDVKELWNFRMGDIELENYQHHPAIKAQMLV